MRYIKRFLLIAGIFCSISSCKKDATDNNCEALKNALIIDAKDDIKTIINTYISQMPSQAYTAANLDVLASVLLKDCAISTQVFCFDCITTLPSMSEIQITVTSTQPNISKVADISYTPDNNMKCVAVHD